MDDDIELAGELCGIVEQLSTDMLAISDPNISKARQFIRENATKSITMADIMNVVPMSQRSLERRYQRFFQCSPVEEIRRVRINAVKALLAETNLTITDIAGKSGYSTYNHLSKTFKEITGITPSAYRKQFR